MKAPAVDLKNRALAALLAWLVPGLGHAYQRRTGKAILYATCILGLYAAGMVLGRGQVVYWRWLNPLHDPENFRFSYLFQLGVGVAALPALIQETLRYFGLAPILGGIMAGPIDVATQNVQYALYPAYGKLIEVGWDYTKMAGLLNILAIYDAYDGPAYDDEAAGPGPDLLPKVKPEGVGA